MRTRYSWWSVLAWAMVVPGGAWALAWLVGVDHGPLVQWIAFTPYAAIGSLLPVVLALALRRWAAAGAAVLICAVLLAGVLPRALPDADPGTPGPRLRVLTANLLVGGGDPGTVVDLVRRDRVDVLALQEYTPGAEAALGALGLAGLLPHRVTNPVPGTEGSALYSRHPLRDVGVRHHGSGFTQAYGTVELPGSVPVLVESVHPMAPHALEVLHWWRADLAAQPAASPGGPVRVLAGDFNATLDHAPLRRLLDTGYRDAADAAGAGLIGTWPSCAPPRDPQRSAVPYECEPIPLVTIDHVLADRRIGVAGVSVHRLPGSDHRAVLATLLPPPAAG